MATVRQLARRMASQGVTQERFIELMSSFGIDPLDPGAQDVEVGEQFASAPLLQGEGPQRGAPMTFEQPAALGFQQQAPAAPEARPMQQRPLPYATDVQRPFEAAPGEPALRSQPTERMPSAVAEHMRQRPVESVARTKQAYPILSGAPGYELPRDAAAAAKWAIEPREQPALEHARELGSGLNPYQRAGLGDIPEVAAARGQAAVTRLGALPGVAAGATASWLVERSKSSRPHEWDSDEDVRIGPESDGLGLGSSLGFTLTPEDRRNWDKRLAAEDMAAVDLLEEIVSDSVMRSETRSFAQNAVRSAMEFTEATFEILSWISGGDIPKEFWVDSSAADRKHVIQDIVGPEFFPAISPEAWEAQKAEGERKQEVLLEEATTRWPQLGRELVAFVSALFHKPYEMAHAHPVPVAALVYPLARMAGVRLGPKAADVGHRAYSAMSKYADEPGVMAGLDPKVAGGAAYVADLANEMWGAFQRWKVDATSVADPAMRPAAEDLLRGGSDVEAGVASLGKGLERTVRTPDPLAELKAQFEQTRAAEPVPEPPAPPSERFTYRDVPGDELPEVAATRHAMGARRAQPSPEGALVPELLAPDAPMRAADTPMPPQPEPLGLPRPGSTPPRVGKYTLSPEAEAAGLRLLEMDTPLLRRIASEAFKGRAPTQLDRAALAEALAYLVDSTRHIATPHGKRAALMAMMREAGGDPFVAAEKAFRAQETPAGARMTGLYEAVSPEAAEPVPDLPEIAATRQVMQRRRSEAAPVEEPARPPDVRAGVEWERARAAASESEQASRGLFDRLDAARGEGLHKTNPREYAKMYDEAIGESHRLEMDARRAVEQARAVDLEAAPAPIPASRALTPIEEVVAPEVIEMAPRPLGEVERWHRPGRAAYEPPSIVPGLQPPPPGRPFGYQFEERVYDLSKRPGQPASLSPAREMTPEGLVDVAPITRDVTPVVQKINPEIMRLVEDAAEWFEAGPIRDVPDFREIAYHEVMAALDDRLANNMQSKAYRDRASRRMAAELSRRSRLPVDPKSVLEILDEAKEGAVVGVRFRYSDWQSGERGEVSVGDVMQPAMRLDASLREAVQGAMLNANMHRLSIRARKLSHQNTVLKSIREWHPEQTTFEMVEFEPATNTAAMEAAAHKRPPINTELDFFKYRYERSGELPPIVRNAPADIMQYAKAQGIKVPGALRRRLSRMKPVPEEMMEAFGLIPDLGRGGVRSVRIRPTVLDKDSGTPQLYMKSDLLQSAKFVFADRMWADTPLAILGREPAGKVAKGVVQLTKKARVALNPSALAHAAGSNTAAAALKWGDPTVPIRQFDWWLDLQRFKKGVPTKRPKAHFEAFMQSNDALESSFAGVELKSSGLLDIAAGDALIKRMMKRGGQVADMPSEFMSKMFDQPDNIAKGWETMKKADRYLSDLAVLPEGKSIGVPIGRNVMVKLTKRAASKPGKADIVMNGKQLTEGNLLRVLMKSAAVDAARTYVNFKNVPLMQVAKRNIPEWDAIFGTPFSGWQSVTTTVPGRQGIVGEILSGPVNRGWTDYVPLMVKRWTEAAMHGAKIGSVIGAQAAQLDEDSELFRLASAWDLDTVKPVIAKPTDRPGVYSVWKIGSADPLEDLPVTIRMLESATSPLESLAFIDPTSVSSMSDRQIELMSKATPEDVAKMSAADRRLYKAALGLSSGGLRAMDTPFKRMLDSAYVGGSAIANVYTALVDARGFPGEAKDIASIIALIKKTAMRSWVPAYAAKMYGAYQEWVVPEIEDKILGIASDGSIPDMEKDEMLAEADRELEIAKYLAGSKFVSRTPIEGGEALDRAGDDFANILFDHWFNLPRPELMVGDKSMTEKLFKEMKARAIEAAGAASKAAIDRKEELVEKRHAEMLSMPRDSAERTSALEQIVALQSQISKISAKSKEVKHFITTEFDARESLLRARDRNQRAIQRGKKRYMKDGLERLNRKPRERGKAYVGKKVAREYKQAESHLFPPGPSPGD